MTEREAFLRFGNIAQKWRDFAERRCADFTELYTSGRWKRYYTEPELIARMREVAGAAETWAKIAPRPTDNVAEEPDTTEPAANPPQRTAA
jgi:uncharacterized repeat protein (TIGR03809 family)